MAKTILVFGAPGAGTTAVGKAISRSYGYDLLDVERYIWLGTDPPYSHRRDKKDTVRILKRDIIHSEKSVITGDIAGWGDVLLPLIDAVVWVDTDPIAREKRIRRKMYDLYGNRILAGGDMYSLYSEIQERARGYDGDESNVPNRRYHEEWAGGLDCRLVCVEGILTLAEILGRISEEIEL